MTLHPCFQPAFPLLPIPTPLQWQNHFDVITILTNWLQDCRQEKEESKETMALEVVTNDHYGKNDKPKKMSRNMYTTREHGKKNFEFCIFCVLPSFVLKDNKYILSCVTECIVCVSVHDPLTFSFLFLFLFGWVGVLWPKLSKVLKLVHWARRVLFPPVFLQ